VSRLLVCCSTVLISVSDPNAPKRGLSAYMFFANEQREKVREDNPGIKFGKSCASNALNTSHAKLSRRGRQDAW